MQLQQVRSLEHRLVHNSGCENEPSRSARSDTYIFAPRGQRQQQHRPRQDPSMHPSNSRAPPSSSSLSILARAAHSPFSSTNASRGAPAGCTIQGPHYHYIPSDLTESTSAIGNRRCTNERALMVEATTLNARQRHQNDHNVHNTSQARIASSENQPSRAMDPNNSSSSSSSSSPSSRGRNARSDNNPCYYYYCTGVNDAMAPGMYSPSRSLRPMYLPPSQIDEGSGTRLPIMHPMDANQSLPIETGVSTQPSGITEGSHIHHLPAALVTLESNHGSASGDTNQATMDPALPPRERSNAVQHFSSDSLPHNTSEDNRPHADATEPTRPMGVSISSDVVETSLSRTTETEATWPNIDHNEVHGNLCEPHTLEHRESGDRSCLGDHGDPSSYEAFRASCPSERDPRPASAEESLRSQQPRRPEHDEVGHANHDLILASESSFPAFARDAALELASNATAQNHPTSSSSAEARDRTSRSRGHTEIPRLQHERLPISWTPAPPPIRPGLAGITVSTLFLPDSPSQSPPYYSVVNLAQESVRPRDSRRSNTCRSDLQANRARQVRVPTPTPTPDSLDCTHRLPSPTAGSASALSFSPRLLLRSLARFGFGQRRPGLVSLPETGPLASTNLHNPMRQPSPPATPAPPYEIRGDEPPSSPPPSYLSVVS